MIDLHCHILPGVDDGAQDLEAACDMAAMALENGTDVIVATPHCNSPRGGDNFRSPRADGLLLRLRERLDHYGLPVQILPGAELQLKGDMTPLLRRDRVYTLNGSRYLLVEFYFDAPGEEMNRQLQEVFRAGFVPVVAHPERYGAVQEDLELAAGWIRQGAVLQVNKGSLAGELSREAFRTADGLLRRELASVIASDAHNTGRRSPVLRPLRYGMEGQFSEDYLQLLFEENPGRIIRDLEVIRS